MIPVLIAFVLVSIALLTVLRLVRMAAAAPDQKLDNDLDVEETELLEMEGKP